MSDIPKNRVTKRWMCGSCNETHEQEWDAEDCCKPDVYEVYLCPVCNDDWGSEESALKCCPDKEAPEPCTQLLPDPAFVFNTEAYINEFGRLNHLVGYTDEPKPQDAA